MRKFALRLDALEAAEGHVFADLADETRADAVNGGAVERESEELFDRGGVLLSDELDAVVSHLEEFRVLRDEVGFGVDFEDRAELAVMRDVDDDDAFGGDAGSGLARLVAELDAQDLLSLGHIAFGFGERLLALHHRGVGLETQLLNLGGGNSSHVH